MRKNFKVLALGALLFLPLTHTAATELSREATTVSEWISHPAIVGGSIRFDRRTGTIVEADATVTIMNIPERIDGVLVTAIGDYAFYQNKNLIAVTIPDTVTTIGHGAFSGCENLTTAVISTGVRVIEDEAFYYCSNLSYMSIPPSVEHIGNSAFAYCSKLPNITIPASVNIIGNSAFNNCDSLTTVAILNNVTSIGDWAFNNCDQLATVSIPTSVVYLGKDVFYSNLKMVYYEGIREQWESLNSGITKAAIIYKSNMDLLNKWIEVDGIEGGKIQFDEKTGTIKVVEASVVVAEIPEYINGVAVTAIGDGAFADCDKLTKITMPAKLSYIGDFAFYSCDSLKTIAIPENVTEINYNTFGYMPSLEQIIIPSSVMLIDPMSLVYNTNLTTIYYGGTKVTWEALGPVLTQKAMVVYESEGPASDEVWYTSNEIPGIESGRIQFDALTGTITAAEEVTVANIPESINGTPVVAIAEDAFRQLDTLTKLTLPKTITFIGNWAFSDCVNLTEIILPEGLKSIGDNAFVNCVSLKKITIPKSVETIGNFAFFGCSSLATATVLDGVQKIGNLAFFDCISLTSIILPQTITFIAADAFKGCNSLKIIYFGGTDQEWEDLNVDVLEGTTVL